MAESTTNSGIYRIGGQYGEVRGQVGPGGARTLAEVTEINCTVEVNRIDMPLVGTTKTGYKPGRESREGSFSIQKIDSSWELEVLRYLSQNLSARRTARRAGQYNGGLRPFQLQIALDDPDALGYETITLHGCLIWRLPMGFNIGDDIITREFPITWEYETFDESFTRTNNVDANSRPTVSQYGLSTPLPQDSGLLPVDNVV
jgi:hypothetical protein